MLIYRDFTTSMTSTDDGLEPSDGLEDEEEWRSDGKLEFSTLKIGLEQNQIPLVDGHDREELVFDFAWKVD
jgi:hypothetical protein